ncbi:MAG: SirB2 family protein [Burkholderiaceae bacterium]|nr:SirB2 family protein [Burkholderiaceae bacterium]
MPGLLKLVHQCAVALSVTGFTLRGAGALAGACWVRSRPARTLPHLIDSVLLLSALALAYTVGFTPANSPWLLAKLLALPVYIGLGVVALRPQSPPGLRLLAWLAALLVLAYIVSVAISKSPLGFLT